MTQYLLSIYQPDGEPPPPPVLEKIMRNMNALIEEIKAAGALVFNGGLCPPSSATVVKIREDRLLVTDGPYAETHEHIGGFLIVRASDLDAALNWATKMARILTVPVEAGTASGLPVEVRPFQGAAER